MLERRQEVQHGAGWVSLGAAAAAVAVVGVAAAAASLSCVPVEAVCLGSLTGGPLRAEETAVWAPQQEAS